MEVAIYIAAILGWLAVYLMLPREQWRLGRVGALLGLASLVGFFIVIALGSETAIEVGIAAQAAGLPNPYFYVFSLIAVVCAVRVITHPRPVYSALYFVMVVLASAGLFLLLQAEFMAFAMVIIYAGAILVTYLFVIMLATEPQPEGEQTSPKYDRIAREPFAGSLVGFVLLAVLTSAFFSTVNEVTTPPSYLKAWVESGLITEQQAATGEFDLNALISEENALTLMSIMPGKASQILEKDLRRSGDLPRGAVIDLPQADIEEGRFALIDSSGKLIEKREVTGEQRKLLAEGLTNIDAVGLNLFQSHTLGIELAAIILLLSMVGAVVIAKKRVDPEVEEGDITGPGRATRIEPTYEPAPTEDTTMGLKTGASE